MRGIIYSQINLWLVSVIAVSVVQIEEILEATPILQQNDNNLPISRQNVLVEFACRSALVALKQWTKSWLQRRLK